MIKSSSSVLLSDLLAARSSLIKNLFQFNFFSFFLVSFVCGIDKAPIWQKSPLSINKATDSPSIKSIKDISSVNWCWTNHMKHSNLPILVSLLTLFSVFLFKIQILWNERCSVVNSIQFIFRGCRTCFVLKRLFCFFCVSTWTWC